MKLLNKIKQFMAQIKVRKFVPTPEETKQTGDVPMATIEIIEALKNYKKQNPAKYEAKKAALFKKYGLDVADEPMLEEVPDESDIELEKLTKKAKKAK